MAASFGCSLVTPQQQILDEPVLYASIPAHDGQIGIAPGRAPLLVELGDGALRLDFEEGGSRFFFVGGGFAQMKGNHLSIIADEAMEAGDIVRQKAEAELEAARQIVARQDEQIDKRLRAIDKARAKISLQDKAGTRI